jgi:hypothetical protein
MDQHYIEEEEEENMQKVSFNILITAEIDL